MAKAMAGAVDYPGSLPMDCAKNVFRIVNERKVMEQKEEFAHCLWNVQGYLQGLLLGEGVPHSLQSAEYAAQAGQRAHVEPKDNQELKDIADALQQCRADLAAGEGRYGAALATQPDLARANWSVLVQLIPVILQLLQQLGVFKSEGVAPMTGLAHEPGQTTTDDESDDKKSKSSKK